MGLGNSIKNSTGIAVSKTRFESSTSKYKLQALQVQLYVLLNMGRCLICDLILLRTRGAMM